MLAGILAALIIIIAVITITSQESKETEDLMDRATYELTEVDIFSIKKWDSRDVSVLGVMLKDNPNTVTDILGFPNKQTAHAPNIVNMEYSKNIGLNKTGLILHFEGNSLKRITIREPFNELLQGNTKIELSKNRMYNMFGKPDDIQFVPLKEGSALVFRNYVYASKGLEVFIRKNEQIGFALFL